MLKTVELVIIYTIHGYKLMDERVKENRRLLENALKSRRSVYK